MLEMFIGMVKPHLYLRVILVAVDGRHGDASQDIASKQVQISPLEADLTAVTSTVLVYSSCFSRLKCVTCTDRQGRSS